MKAFRISGCVDSGAARRMLGADLRSAPRVDDHESSRIAARRLRPDAPIASARRLSGVVRTSVSDRRSSRGVRVDGHTPAVRLAGGVA